MEGSYGNGFLDRLEHRKQFKINGGRVFHVGDHTLTLFGIGYYGYSYMAGLRPIHGFNSVDAADGWKEYPDTIDPRQRDQTHTALMALNDVWKLGEDQELQLSGILPHLQPLAVFGLWAGADPAERVPHRGRRQRGVYVKKFSKKFTLLAGTDYQREAPRRDDLDHYNFYNPADPYLLRAFRQDRRKQCDHRSGDRHTSPGRAS